VKIIKTKFKDLVYFEDTVYKDNRGILKELFNKKKINKKFIFEFVSLSKKNVVRGLHFQIKKPQAKFISVVYGKIFDVVIDLRKKSKTFGRKFEIILDSKKNTSLYIPEGFAHGFKSLENNSIMIYACDNKRYPKLERSIIWNDKGLKINWPNKNKNIISLKDKKNTTFEEFKKINKF
jgi:dTDP-4-dehydrorhamnose 3,5-epimerase